jgi:UDP-glucose:O-linked fucose beta-1,3-glucosyltransferase
MFSFNQDDVRRVKRVLEKWTSERSDLTSKIEEIELHNDSSNRQLKQNIADKQVSVYVCVLF